MILDANYQVEQILLTTCDTDGQWRHVTVPVGDYAGQTIVIFFEVLNSGGASGLTTWMYVDDVALYEPGYHLTTLPMVLARH
jgi:protocatechuate 3,4-dioxygenase beta subunit